MELWDALGVLEREAVWDEDGLSEMLGDTLRELLGDGEAVFVGVREGLGVRVGLGVLEGVGPRPLFPRRSVLASPCRVWP